MKERYTTVTVLDAAQNVVSVTETEETGAESSVEISQNAKGEPRVTVKVYHADPAEASRQAVDLYYSTIANL